MVLLLALMLPLSQQDAEVQQEYEEDQQSAVTRLLEVVAWVRLRRLLLSRLDAEMQQEYEEDQPLLVMR